MPTGARFLGRCALPIALALLLAAPADGRAQPGQWLRYGLNDGGTRYLQVWYRDADFQCGTYNNLTNGFTQESWPQFRRFLATVRLSF